MSPRARIQPRRQQPHGPLDAAMAAALPAAAQQLLRAAGGHLDAAAAFIASAGGLSVSLACSRERNGRRWGPHWPDRPVFSDLPTATSTTAADPLAILEAVEAGAAALCADDAAARLAAADTAELDTAELARQLRVTLRRAQQLKKEKMEAARRGQAGLDFGGEK